MGLRFLVVLPEATRSAFINLEPLKFSSFYIRCQKVSKQFRTIKVDDTVLGIIEKRKPYGDASYNATLRYLLEGKRSSN